MKKIFASLAVLALLLAAVPASGAVHHLLQTTTTAAVNATTSQIPVAATTSMTASNMSLYIDAELMDVLSIDGLTINVRRGSSGTRATAHNTGSYVVYGFRNLFYAYDAAGSCTAGSEYVTPWINIRTGNEFLCGKDNKWVAGWGNPGTSAVPIGATADVASAAGLITPSGPLFHITGALAITGFNIPVGYRGGTFCVIPDGAFTTTNANNITKASTAVVDVTICWAYDGNDAKPFTPTY